MIIYRDFLTRTTAKTNINKYYGIVQQQTADPLKLRLQFLPITGGEATV